MANANSQTTYSSMIKKQAIAPLLKLDPNGPWDIVSETETGLSMVHHKNDCDMDIYGALRGVVVDMNKGNVVCYSYPHSPKFVTSHLKLENGKVKLSDDIVLDIEKIKIKPGFEGPLIHVFKHGGKVYRSTRKRFDPSKSRWGNSKTFEEIYWDLQGPSDEVLFDSDKDYSPYCHTFIMVHPDMLVCTKYNIGDGYLVYLGPKQMYSIENCPYPVEQVDDTLRVPNTTSSEFQNEEKKVYSPELMSLETANKHLTFGFYEEFPGYEHLDARLLPSEFVIIEDCETGDMYRIESPGYNWRSSMRNNNPNLLHRFHELLDHAYLKNTKEDTLKYKTTFPVLTFFDTESLEKTVENSPIIVWPQNTETELKVPTTRDTKLYNIWQCFLVSVPLCRQKEVVNYYSNLNSRRNEIVEWLDTLSRTENLDLETFSKRVQDILVKTKLFAKNRVKKGENIDYKTREVKSLEALTRDNIKNFISKELGSSLYRILKEMDRYKNPRPE